MPPPVVAETRKIGPSLASGPQPTTGRRPDNTPDDNDRVEIGPDGARLRGVGGGRPGMPGPAGHAPGSLGAADCRRRGA